jgi:hypothetical protein
MKNKHQRGKSGDPRHIRLYYFMMQTEAWKDLNAIERAVYVDLSSYYNGSNNGRIGYSARTAARNLKIGKGTAARALRSLQAHGFIVVEKPGAFHCKIRHASEYRLTVYPSDVATYYADTLATKDFTRWPEIQNTVPPVRPTGLVVRPIGPRAGTMSSKKASDGPSRETVGAVLAK